MTESEYVVRDNQDEFRYQILRVWQAPRLHSVLP